MRWIRYIVLVLVLCLSAFLARAQVVVGGGEPDDPLKIDYSSPKSYEIGGITFEGAENFDTRVVQLVAGL